MKKKDININSDEQKIINLKEQIILFMSNLDISIFLKEEIALFIIGKCVIKHLSLNTCTPNYNFILDKYDIYNCELDENKIRYIEEKILDIDLYNIYYPSIFYPFYIEQEKLKNFGEFFTPVEIIKFMINRVSEYIKFEDKSVLDFACGNGMILYEVIRNKFDIRKISGNDVQTFCSFLAEINSIIASIIFNKYFDASITNFDSILEHQEFEKNYDIIISNPPYIGQKNNKELFEKLKGHPYWSKFYTSKSDYLYFFVILGLEQLKENGVLCLVTPQYWLTASKGNKLREYILQNAEILEIHNFDKIRIFPNAKGQENIIILLRKTKIKIDKDLKVFKYNYDFWSKNRELWSKLISSEISSNKNDEIAINIHEDPQNDLILNSNKIKQSELTSEPWFILSDGIKIKYKGKYRLGDLLITQPGIQTGADYVNKKNSYVKDNIAILKEKGINLNDGIYVISDKELIEMNLKNDELNIIKKFFKVGDLSRYSIPSETNHYLIYSELIDDIEKYPNIKKHLERYKDILKVRFKTYSLINDEKNGKWWKLVGARPGVPFEGEKIIHPYRAIEPYFLYSNTSMYSSIDIFYTYKKEECNINLKFICSLLNSRYVRNYLEHNCKKKGVKFELYKEPISNIPIPNIDLNNKFIAKLYQYVSGEYVNEFIDNENYKYHHITNTWVKKKGIFDLLLEKNYFLKSIEKKYNKTLDIKRICSFEDIDEWVTDIDDRNFIYNTFRILAKDEINDIKSRFNGGSLIGGIMLDNIYGLELLIDLTAEYLYNLSDN